MGGRETVRTGGKGDETLRRGGEREKGREGGEVDPPQFSLNEKKGEDEGGGRGGKSRREEREGGVVGEGKVRESGKMENSAGWVENHRTSPVLRFGEPAGGRARFVLKSFYNSERAATWCLYHVFVSFYSFPLFSSLFFLFFATCKVFVLSFSRSSSSMFQGL